MAQHRNKAKKSSHKTAMAPGYVGLILVLCAVSVISVATFDRYAFTGTDLFPLWYVALGVGILGGALFALKVVAPEHGTGKRIGVFILISLLCSFAAGTMLAHANHLFDTSQPVRYTVVIEDTEYRHRKHVTHRKFTVTAQGDTFDIEVPARHYRAFEEGDLYVVEYREGAFGEPYYIAVGGVSEEADKP